MWWQVVQHRAKMGQDGAKKSQQEPKKTSKSLQDEPVLAMNGKRERVREFEKHLGEHELYF